MFQIISEGEMLIKSNPKTPLQKSCESMVESEIIFISIIGPDDNCYCSADLLAWMAYSEFQAWKG